MVSLVLVSHSRALAEAVVALARQVAPPTVNILVAAGIGDDRSDYGTDAVEISEAIQSLDPLGGILVLMDLGSAILSAEMAFDLLPDEIRTCVRLCPAALVEGAISAAVQAGLGSDIDTVYSAAAESLQPKLDHLGVLAGQNRTAVSSSDKPKDESHHVISVTLPMLNPHGLHARPAARIVQVAATFDADILVHKVGSDAMPAPARSLNKLATLGVGQNDLITVTARGRDAAAAIAALRQLIESGFGELSPATMGQPDTDIKNQIVDKEVQPGAPVAGAPVSPGIAFGPLRRYHPSAQLTPVTPGHIDDPAIEWQRLQTAIRQTRENIAAIQKATAVRAGDQQASIFEAHRLMLDDVDLLERARQLIVEDHDHAAHAWLQAVNSMAANYRTLPDPYIRQRAVDLMDVGAQVIAILGDGAPEPSIDISQPCILLGDEFSPRQIAELDASRVLGIITSAGSANSHASILARALSIPAVAAIGYALESVSDTTVVGIDGFTGSVWINPSPDTLAHLVRHRKQWLDQQKQLRSESAALTSTSDGRRIEIAANLSGLVDAGVAVSQGAEAVGVLRTEFLYLTRDSAPSEDEQVAALGQIAGLMQGRPVIVRTLDVGGDKPLPYLPLPPESNPYLGVRAIRLSLLQPQLFILQVRAILRSALDNELRILLPMITVVEELQQARLLIEDAHHSLLAEGAPHKWPVPLGIMVETPAAALLALHLTHWVDFFSIGTNDLTQYTLAAERGNTQVRHLSDALHPSVLRLIGEVVDAAHQHGKWVAVCGEVAADPEAVPVLVGLGVDELSMNVSSIPQVKAIVRKLSMPAAKSLAHAALQAATAAEVRRLVQQRASA